MKPREETIQTHRWIQKSKLADRGYIYLYIYKLNIFDREPTHQNFIMGEILSFESSKDRSIEAELEVQIRKGKFQYNNKREIQIS
jgi:hypothetical protein